MNDASDDVLLIDAGKAANMLSISKRSLWSMAQTGELPSVRFGRRVLFDPADLKAWVARKKQRGADISDSVEVS